MVGSGPLNSENVAGLLEDLDRCPSLIRTPTCVFTVQVGSGR